ncbi:hypothetical protein BD626DRAFT_481464 [Schizophyllum amplum]|uniref:F-box domain-containing protein n=1 Tax=Schizophyllum amplum TaxID=97359 RepID=A0A550CU91_9AGAR|nr:hypothetical protein BD626DRAFT_481464 [Auriculariopsis ampla]
MATVLALPVEVFDRIFQHLQPRELAVASRASSTFYHTAIRLLYRDIHMSSATTNLSLVVMLARRPEYAQHVRSFRITGDIAYPLCAFYRSVARALRRMPYLTSLDLALDHRTSWVLANCTFPHLLTFRCTFAMDASVASLLTTTPLLRDLEVHSLAPDATETAFTIPRSALRRLESFTGSCDVALSIVPSRPVGSVHLASGDCTSEVVERLAESSSSIAILTAWTSVSPIMILPCLARCMSKLFYLRLDAGHGLLGPGDVDLYHGIAQQLTTMRELRAFELSGIYWPSSMKDGTWEWRSPLPSKPPLQEDREETVVQSDLLWQYY